MRNLTRITEFLVAHLAQIGINFPNTNASESAGNNSEVAKTQTFQSCLLSLKVKQKKAPVIAVMMVS